MEQSQIGKKVKKTWRFEQRQKARAEGVVLTPCEDCGVIASRTDMEVHQKARQHGSFRPRRSSDVRNEAA